MSSTESPETAWPALGPAVLPTGPESLDGEVVGPVSLPGLTLTVRRRHGQREGLQPALFVHGLDGASDNWSALMRRLHDVVECEALDLPGFGYSPPPDDGNYSISGHARAVVRLMEASGRGPVHLFGNSMGGMVATRIAALRPDLVRTLTLVSPALPELLVQRAAWFTALASVPGLPQLYTRTSRGWSAEQRARTLAELVYGDPSSISAEAMTAATCEVERRMALPYYWDALIRSTRGIVNAYTLGGQHCLWRQAERVLAPTLLVYGGRDKMVSFRVARKAAKAFRHSCLVTIPDGGHVSMMEHPDVVARAFLDLLAVAERRSEQV
ncbi:MAG: alpha/beta hydrolase [Streptomycetaceae bacterium]|nr:alpha/beta hydrolase [Streptomycetaceae bacterium]